MKILVCMKQVAEIVSAVLDDNYILNREKGGLTVNPPDCAALEQALLMKEANGAEITVVTMGTESAEDILKQVSALDIDRLVLISDKSFRGSDTLATANILKKTADYLGPFDLILMGRRAVDGETGHVGPEVAAMFGIPCITNTTDITSSGGREIVCERLLEDCRLKLSVQLPAVVTVCGGTNRLRPASIEGLRRAKTARIIRITNKELMLPEDKVGLCGSPTKVTGVSKPNEKGRGGKYYFDPVSGAKAIAQAIRLYETGDLEKKEQEPAETEIEIKPSGLHGVCVFEKDKESLGAGEELIHHCLKSGCKAVKIVVRDENVFDDLQEAIEISKSIAKYKFDTLVFPATITGRAIAPMVAALDGLGITADCTELHYMEDGRLVQIRPAFGETVLAEIETKTLPQIATVRPGVYKLPESGRNDGAETIEVTVTPGNVRMISQSEMKTAGLGEAKGIVSGGKACGKEGFACLSALADELGFALGATRSAVVEGYAPYQKQIGQTGITVRSRLYLAFGISGSVQHLAGMKDSDFIIAVNTDRKARIFYYADICVVADWKETAAALLAELNCKTGKDIHSCS